MVGNNYPQTPQGSFYVSYSPPLPVVIFKNLALFIIIIFLMLLLFLVPGPCDLFVPPSLLGIPAVDSGKMFFLCNLKGEALGPSQEAIE